MRILKQFLLDEQAATAVEYAVMLAMIIAVCFVAIGQLGHTASQMWDSNGTNLNIAWQAAGGGS